MTLKPMLLLVHLPSASHVAKFQIFMDLKFE